MPTFFVQVFYTKETLTYAYFESHPTLYSYDFHFANKNSSLNLLATREARHNGAEIEIARRVMQSF